MNRTILGIVGKHDSESSIVADFLKRLESSASKWGLPLEALPLPDWTQVERHETPEAGWQGILLGNGVQARPWIQKLEAPAVIMVPFLTADLAEPSWLIWPHEEVSRLKVGDGTLQASRIETTVLTQDAARACAEIGLQYASENSGYEPAWIHAGWGELEDFALLQAREVFEDRLPILTVEAANRQAGTPGPKVWIGIARTALPLARILNTQCWLAFHRDTQRFVAQSISEKGSTLLLWAILNRLGYFAEAAQVLAERHPEGTYAEPATQG
jgi:hypothetical protein